MLERTIRGSIVIAGGVDSDEGGHYLNLLEEIHEDYVGCIEAGEGDLVAASFRAKAAELACLKSEN